MSIKDFFRKIFNRNKRLPEGRSDEYYEDYTPRSATSTSTTSARSHRSEFAESLRIDNYSSSRNREVKPINLVTYDEIKKSAPSKYKDSYSNQQMHYTGRRAQRFEAQQRQKAAQERFRKKLALGVASLAIAASCLAACSVINQDKSYEEMSITELEQILENDTLSQEDLSSIATALEEDGILALKGKVANSLGMDENAIDYIKIYASSSQNPAMIETPIGDFRTADGVVDPDRADVISDGIGSVSNSIGFLQGNENITQDELNQFVDLIQKLEESEFSVTNNIVGQTISTNNEEELLRLSLAETEQDKSHEDDEER